MLNVTRIRSNVSCWLGAASLLTALSIPAFAVPVLLITEQSGTGFKDVVTDANFVYAASFDGISRAPIAGGASSTLYLATQYTVSGSWDLHGLTRVGTNLFWGDAQSGIGTLSQILRAPASGAGPIVALFGQTAPSVDVVDITTNGTNLFTVDAVSGTVHRFATDGSGLVQIGPARYGGGFGNARLNAITAPGDLYVATSAVKTSSVPASEVLVPKIESHANAANSDPWNTVLSGPPLAGDGPLGITSGDGHLFFTQGSSIFETDLAGMVLREITDAMFHNLRDLTFDGGFLYVTDNILDAQGNFVSGRVLRVDLAEAPEPASLLLLLAGLPALLLATVRTRRRASSTAGIP